MAWDIKIENFPKEGDVYSQIKFILQFAILAPSSHNSQPWRFNINDSKIEIFLDENRKLPFGDRHNRQAYISLGCAIENIIIATNYFNLESQCELIDSPDSLDKVAIIEIKQKLSKEKSEFNNLIFSILKRRTNRGEYLKRLPPGDLLKKINSFSNNFIKIFIISDQNRINNITEVVLKSSTTAMADKNFRVELSKYIKNNLTNSYIGIPAFGMNIPTPISFLVPRMIKYLNMNKISYKNDEKLLKNKTPVMVIIAANGDNKKIWIQVGRIYEKIALEATKIDLSTSIWGAPIESGNLENLQKILSTNLRPQVFFRLGYPKQEAHRSPRIHLNKLFKN